MQKIGLFQFAFHGVQGFLRLFDALFELVAFPGLNRNISHSLDFIHNIPVPEVVQQPRNRGQQWRIVVHRLDQAKGHRPRAGRNLPARRPDIRSKALNEPSTESP